MRNKVVSNVAEWGKLAQFKLEQVAGTDDLTVGRLWLLVMADGFGDEGVGSGRLIRNLTDPQNYHVLLINTKQSSAGVDGDVLLVFCH